MFSLIERQHKRYIQQLFTADVDSLEETVFRNCGKNFWFEKILMVRYLEKLYSSIKNFRGRRIRIYKRF